MKKIFKNIVICIALLLCAPLFAETATVTFIHGKAEVQKKDGNWYPLNVGDTIEEMEVISTGFYSDIKLEYKSSIVALGALTRVTLENMSSSEERDNVSLYLNTGAVRSKVNHTKERRVSYVVKTPVAVASVRGTDFTITASGSVTCNEGAVVVFPNIEIKNTAKKSTSEQTEEETEEESELEDLDDDTPVITEAVANDNNEVTEVAMEKEVETETAKTDSGDYGPASSITPAKAIADNAPAGAIVVGKSQTVSISGMGTTETPIASASKKSQQAKTVVTTAASQEAEIVGTTSAATQSAAKEVISASENIVVKTGKITAEVVLQD